MDEMLVQIQMEQWRLPAPLSAHFSQMSRPLFLLKGGMKKHEGDLRTSSWLELLHPMVGGKRQFKANRQIKLLVGSDEDAFGA